MAYFPRKSSILISIFRYICITLRNSFSWYYMLHSVWWTPWWLSYTSLHVILLKFVLHLFIGEVHSCAIASMWKPEYKLWHLVLFIYMSPWMELGSSVLVASTFIHWAILSAHICTSLLGDFTFSINWQSSNILLY